MERRFAAIALVSLVLIGSGCLDSHVPIPPTAPSGAPQSVALHVSGTVVDLDAVPVPGALVSVVLGGSARTDDNGRFELPAMVVPEGARVTLSVGGDPCLSASTTITATSSNANVEFKVTRVHPLSIDGSETAFLRPTDPPLTVFGWTPGSAWHARHYRIASAASSDVSVELSWERVGNADLLIWAHNGDWWSEPVGDRQVLLLRGGVTTNLDLVVVQPSQANPLSQPVRFTLEVKRAGG